MLRSISFVVALTLTLQPIGVRCESFTPGRVGDETVHFAYVIPSNRTPQAGGVEKLQAIVLLMDAWLSEQMDRNGFGPRGLRYETEPDGVTPVIHVINVDVTDAYLRGDIWGRTNTAVAAAGVALWSAGEVWVLFPEAHEQQPDGSIIGGVALGGGFGTSSGETPGVALMDTTRLWLSYPDALTDDTPYAGEIVPEIGPFPLVQDVSYPWFEGSTRSQLASVFIGATAHELGHALGLAHDLRNDSNFHGNVMANGLRGIRGTLLRDSYPQDDSRLSFSSALALSVNRYLKPPGASRVVDKKPRAVRAACSEIPERTLSATQRSDVLGVDCPVVLESAPLGSLGGDCDNTPPAVTIHTSGTVSPVDGLVEMLVTATDPCGLALALLRRNGDTIDERVLTGEVGVFTFRTPFYEPGQSQSFMVTVYDTAGNRREVSQELTVSSGGNTAPKPFFKVQRSWSDAGEVVTLDATGTTDTGRDPNLFSWDLDGDTSPDTAAVPSKVHTVAFEPGARTVRLNVSDSAGAISISTPIAQRVEVCLADTNRDGALSPADFTAWIAAFNAGAPECDQNADGSCTPADFSAWIANYNAGC